MHAHHHTLILRKLVSAFIEHVFAICCLRKQKIYLTFLSSGVANTTCSVICLFEDCLHEIFLREDETIDNKSRPAVKV